jgi:hypothetical protein
MNLILLAVSIPSASAVEEIRFIASHPRPVAKFASSHCSDEGGKVVQIYCSQFHTAYADYAGLSRDANAAILWLFQLGDLT